MSEMIPTPEDLARDAAADMAVCEAAVAGPWKCYTNKDDTWEGWPVIEYTGERGTEDYGGFSVYGGHGYCERVEEAAHFIATARAALPAWIRRAVAAEAKLRELLADEPEVKEFHYTPEGGAEVTIEHWAVKHLAASLYDTFDKEGGPNFLTVDVGGFPRGPLEVTIRPKWGTKTPAEVHKEKMAEKDAEVARLKQAIADLRTHYEDEPDYCE